MDFSPLIYFYGALYIGIIGISFIINALLFKKYKIGKIFLGIGIIFLMPALYFGIYLIQQEIDRWKALSPMQKAIGINRYNKVKRLIEEGYNINEYNTYSFSSTALMYAVEKGNIRIVRLLVENGADVNHKPHDRPSMCPLDRAIWRGDTAIVNYLLAKGADVSGDSFYPVEFAIRRYKPNNKEIVEALIKYGADFRSNNDLPLGEAINYYYYDIVRCLLENGAGGYNKRYFKNEAIRKMDFLTGSGKQRERNKMQLNKIIELLDEYIQKEEKEKEE